MVASVALILGGFFWLTRPRIVELREHPLPTRVNVDYEIFDVVLADMLVTDKSTEDSDIARSITPLLQLALGQLTRTTIPAEKKSDARLVVNVKSQEGYPEEIRGSNDIWSILAKNQIDPEILQDVNDRNRRGVRYLLTAYKPENPAIAVRDLEADPRWGDYLQAFDLPNWAFLELPGYSSDGKTAVLKLTFGPTPHGAWGVYLLKRTGGRWVILDKQFLFLT
jgi:hypothetical protein